MDIRGYLFNTWIGMDMDEASQHTDGYGWMVLKSIWIWMDTDMSSFMDWIGLDGYTFEYIRVLQSTTTKRKVLKMPSIFYVFR